MENKNTVIALVLMLVVWLGFSFLFPPSQPTQAPAPVVGSETATAPATSAITSVAPAAEAQPAADLVPTQAQAERQILVENQRFKALFTSSGGRLKSLELKEYRVTPVQDSAPVVLLPAGPLRQAALRTSGNDGFTIADDAYFQVADNTGDELRLSGEEKKSLTLTHTTPSGLQIRKTYNFQGDSYGFELQVELVNHASAPLSGTSGLVLVSPWDENNTGSTTEHVGPTSYVGEKLQQESAEDLVKDPVSYGKDVLWSAFETKYFIAIVAPLEGAAETTQLTKTGSQVENLFQTPYTTLQPGQASSFNYRIYYGPKDGAILEKAHPDFGKAIDFGFFSLLAAPLLKALKFINNYVGNYGVAIILVTIVIKILFWPLTQKSYSSMKAMANLQPEITKVRERCKNDREKLNREIMELYKKHRVNPMGGCLPMLVQIPVFFALYKVLMDTIDLRHADFALWITDLSAKDPYYITPVIMGATMFIQQKMSPSTMDPVQAKVFMLMPVIFTFLFLNFPSGLVLYWLVNNLLTILQQYFINKKA
jgi:YidC/Oxa1 family membrane protein insertase